ncbi:MAG: ATP-binding protein [Bacteroidales bacterium]|nr:ATP-binding protein [Bacteroidales bacterium]
MLRRKIQKILEEYFRNGSNKILIISGARQIGKSFIIRQEGKKHFKNFIEIDLIEDKNGKGVFANVSTKEDFYLRLSSFAGERMKEGEKTLIFLDEIQAYPQLLTLLKFLKADNRFTYIVSGSLLGLALKQTLSKPGGSIEVIQMYQLDFEEFLWANGVGEDFIEHIKNCFENRISVTPDIHKIILDLFKKFLLVGGLPDAVNSYIQTHNIVNVRSAQKEVYQLYKGDAGQYDTLHKLAIERIYELVPSYLENKKKRVVYNSIEGKKNARSEQYTEEFEYLSKSGICNEVRAVANPKFPLIESEEKNLLKLYLNDTGLLTRILYQNNISAIMDDTLSLNLGAVYEQVVCSELTCHGFPLFYYHNKKKGEVDFLIDDYNTLSAVPIEIKSGKDVTRHASLTKFVNNADYNIKQAFVLSNDNRVRIEGKITYMPIYYVMFFTPYATKGSMLF